VIFSSFAPCPPPFLCRSPGPGAPASGYRPNSEICSARAGNRCPAGPGGAEAAPGRPGIPGGASVPIAKPCSNATATAAKAAGRRSRAADSTCTIAVPAVTSRSFWLPSAPLATHVSIGLAVTVSGFRCRSSISGRSCTQAVRCSFSFPRRWPPERARRTTSCTRPGPHRLGSRPAEKRWY
jgi:hypothetical protein